jgi:hypothetical protein
VNFFLNKNMQWCCEKCKSYNIKEKPEWPETNPIYQEKHDQNLDDVIEQEITDTTDMTLDLTCLECGNKHFDVFEVL